MAKCNVRYYIQLPGTKLIRPASRPQAAKCATSPAVTRAKTDACRTGSGVAKVPGKACRVYVYKV